jgi:hypothetical protein
MMLVALRCDDVKASAEFYASLGFGVGARYPYARPNDGAGQFEPTQPAGLAYLSPAANSMGVLLLPRREGRGGFFFGGGRLGPLVPNLALASLNVVKTGAAAGADAPDAGDGGGGGGGWGIVGDDVIGNRSVGRHDIVRVAGCVREGTRGDEGGGQSFRCLDDDRCDFLTRANDDSVRGGGDGVGGCCPRVEVDTDS